ncbi:MAG: cation:proton antiporter [Thermoleophilia bacterium]|nr:cation:proton antiporter [Thermoleophilia bacterium]
MTIGFGEALLLIGILLAVGAGLSGWLHGTVLSISVLSVAAGLALAIADVVTANPGDEIVVFAVELALVLTLFSDGLFVEDELLRRYWGPPTRALVFAMPITLAFLALVGKALFPTLTWAEAFLLGAVLSPTDPVVTSAVVTAEQVPRRVRHTLNLESGLNDGLALPFVLFFLAAAVPGGASPAREAGELAAEALVGAAIGLALAALAGRLLPYLPGGGLTHKYEGTYALGVGLLAFGLADVTYGNGLIAAFVGGIVLAFTRHEVPAAFREFNETVSATFQIVTFFLFGALIVATGWHGNTWALAAFVAFALFVARPAAVLISFVGVALPRREKSFIAWFGPKGVASMLFALLVLNSADLHRTLVFDVASFVILSSIVAHGLTDTVGARWIERRLGDADQDDVRGEIEADEEGRRRAVVPPSHG